MKNIKRISLFVLTVLMLATFMIQSSQAETTLEQDIIAKQKLESQINSIKNARNSIQKTLNDLKSQQADKQKQVTLIYEEINNYQSEIDTVSFLILEYQNLINEKEAQIAELNSKLDKNYELFKRRIVFAQESGNMGYIDFILGSSDISDILSRGEVINDMLNYDKEIISSISEDKKKIESTKEEIKQTLSLCEQRQKDCEALVEELKIKAAEAQTYVNQLKLSVNEQNHLLSEQNRLKDQSEKALIELNRQIQTKSNPNFDSTFIWPLSASYPGTISQYFHSGHSGLDIAVGGWKNNGKIPALACASGYVTLTRYASDWGNRVVIKHNDKFQTYYAHLASFSVSEGQYVTKGQQIGYIGSTGDSTGPHLHLVFVVDGVRKDPMLYIRKP